MKKICKSPKDSETINLGILADITRHTANQIQQLLGKSPVGVKIFTDSLGTLESIASSHQVERRMMRADIADLKEKLESRDVDKYCWLQDERMLADILTKERKEKLGLDGLMRDNILDVVQSENNCVAYNNGEFEITGRNLRERLLPNPKLPKRKTVKEKGAQKERREKTEVGECV